MNHIACPSCGFTLLNDPTLAGVVCACPQCGQHVQMPAAVSVVYPPQIHGSPVSQTPAVMFVSTSPAGQDRLASHGWFTRSFMAAIGVCLAVLAIFVGIPLAIDAASKGTSIIADRDASQVRKAQSAEAISQARKALRMHGIDGEISQGTTYTHGQHAVGGLDSVTGHIKTSQGIKEFHVYFQSAIFNGTRTFELKHIIVDGQTVYQSPR